MKAKKWLLLVPVVCLVAAATWFCNIPVFRYALERWPADPYVLNVVHHGPLTEAQKEVLEEIDEAIVEGANLYVHRVKVKEKEAGLPRMELHYPEETFEMDPVIWSAPLTSKSVQSLVDSPVRKEIEKRILEGESAVWLFLECGDKAKDDAAAALIGEQLDVLQQVLELPPLTNDPSDRLVTEEIPLRMAFSLIRVSRTDPAEEVLVRILLSSEGDLEELKEPMAFPVFGRGRALQAMLGKGINKQNIEGDCVFITGACSCLVKQLNPGWDLLITASWLNEFGELAVEESIIPPILMEPIKLKSASEAPEVLPASEPSALLAPSMFLPVIAAAAVGVGLLLTLCLLMGSGGRP